MLRETGRMGAIGESDYSAGYGLREFYAKAISLS